MSKVITTLAAEGSGKSSILGNAAWGIDKIVNSCFSGTDYTPRIRILDPTPESTITGSCTPSRTADIAPLESNGHVADHVQISRNTRGTSVDVNKARDSHPIIYVDTSSSVPEQRNELLQATDSILYVTTPNEDLGEMLALWRTAIEARPGVALELLAVNRYDPTSSHDQIRLDKLKEFFTEAGADPEKYILTVPRTVSIQEAAEQKRFVYHRDPMMRQVFDGVARKLVKGKPILPLDTLVKAVEEKTGIKAPEPNRPEMRTGDLYSTAAGNVALVPMMYDL